MRGRGRRHRREPGPDRRRDGARDPRRRLPVLQRQQGPAVRPDLPGQGRAPERRPAHGRQRRQGRRHAHRRGHRDQAAPAGERPRDRRRGPHARQGRRPAAGGLDADRPAAVRARPQVRGDHPRQVAGELPGRRHDPDRARRDAGGARRVPEHVRRGHALGLAGEPRRLRHRVRRARRVDQHRDRRLPPAAARRHPGDAEPLGPADQPRAVRGRDGDTAAIVAPAAEAQASLFRNLDTTMRALNAVARPYIQDSITGGKPALDAGIESLPNQRPFLANTEGLLRELRPGARSLRTAAPALSDALGAGIEVLPKTPRAQPAARFAARRGADVLQRPARAARPPGHERARAGPRPRRWTTSRPPRRSATTSRSSSATSPRC